MEFLSSHTCSIIQMPVLAIIWSKNFYNWCKRVPLLWTCACLGMYYPRTEIMSYRSQQPGALGEATYTAKKKKAFLRWEAFCEFALLSFHFWRHWKPSTLWFLAAEDPSLQWPLLQQNGGGGAGPTLASALISSSPFRKSGSLITYLCSAIFWYISLSIILAINRPLLGLHFGPEQENTFSQKPESWSRPLWSLASWE